MKKHLLLLTAGLLFAGCGDDQSEAALDGLEYSHYDIQLKIIPDEQFIQVDGSLKYLVTDDSLGELAFNLHKNLAISDFRVNGDNSFQLDTTAGPVPWIPDAVKIICPLEKQFRKGEILDVEFSYQGQITQWPVWSANVLSADWIEMGLYFPWYPSTWGLFTCKVAVDIDPAYHVFAMGKASEKDNKKIFATEFPVDDFIICAAKDLTIRETKLLNQSFQIVNCTLSETTVDSMQADIQNLYQSYSNWFGDIPVQDMCLVVSKRENGGGYSRRGGLFLGGLNDADYLNKRIDFIQYLAHEIAHFWWHGAAGNWEDWLNESFAEYSAMRLIRELHSKEEFASRLNIKRNDSTDTPPVWEISRSDPFAEKVLYGKGVVLLSELEEKIGKDKFLELCKARINNRVNNTSDFITLVGNLGGTETADWFAHALKTR